MALGLALLTQTTMALAQEAHFSNKAIWASGTFRTEYGASVHADGKHYTTQEFDDGRHQVVLQTGRVVDTLLTSTAFDDQILWREPVRRALRGVDHSERRPVPPLVLRQLLR